MKWSTCVVTGLLAVGLFASFVGCRDNHPVSVGGKDGKKLTLKPLAAASIKQGETTTVNVEIVREKFNDPIELKFSGLPDGVAIVENETTIPKDANSAKFTLKAGAEAKPVDDQKVTVAAASGDLKLNSEFKVSVKKGDNAKKLSLKAPADVSIKPGESAPINIEITRDKFSDPVELKFAGLPEGVSIVEKDLTIPKDAASTKFTLQAAADAKGVGDHKVTVTATGGGVTQEATFKVIVGKKG